MLSLFNTLLSPPQGPPVYVDRFSNIAEPHFVHFLREAMSESGRIIERFHAVFLDADREYLADKSMGHGKASSVSFRLRELFGVALDCGASSLLVAHSHPSGVCRPSRSDINETTRLIEVGKALDIELLDHVIITRHAAYSMRMGEEL